MQLNTRSTVVTLVITLIIGVVAFSFFHFFEKVEGKGWKPLTGEAKSNPLFASRLFLKRMGIPTQSIDSLQSAGSLPSTNSVIVMTAARHHLSTEKVDELLEWIHQGGHLIIPNAAFLEKSAYTFEDNRLVNEPQNLSTTTAMSNDPIQHAMNVHIDIDDHIDFPKDGARHIQLPNASESFELSDGHYHPIILDADNESLQIDKVQLDNNNLIIRQTIGSGLITLVSQLNFIEYQSLNKYDHAEIFWHLVHRTPVDYSPPDEVWLIHSDESPNLLSLVWKHFWAFIIMLTLLFLAWVLRATRRFGPLVPKQGEDRRHLMEHINASGAYYWKNKQSDTLLDSTRTAVQQRLKQRIPGWHSLSKDQQAEAVATRLTLAPQHIFQVLHGHIPHNPHDFTEAIKQLEYIRTQV